MVLSFHRFVGSNDRAQPHYALMAAENASEGDVNKDELFCSHQQQGHVKESSRGESAQNKNPTVSRRTPSRHYSQPPPNQQRIAATFESPIEERPQRASAPS
jgi:hypothetical protein